MQRLDTTQSSYWYNKALDTVDNLLEGVIGEPQENICPRK